MVSQFLTMLSQFALSLISTLGYPGIFLVMALENIFPPIPSEVVMPFAGFLVSLGRFNLSLTIVLGSLGALLGSVPYYFLGSVLGGEKFRGLLRKYGKYALVSENDLDRAEQWFNAYQEKAVFLARVIPLARTFISVPAGFVKMRFPKFLIYTFAGTLLWTSFLTLLGFFLGENWERVEPYIRGFDYLFVLLFAVLFIVYVVRKHKVRRKQKTTEDGRQFLKTEN